MIFFDLTTYLEWQTGNVAEEKWQFNEEEWQIALKFCYSIIYRKMLSTASLDNSVIMIFSFYYI